MRIRDDAIKKNIGDNFFACITLRERHTVRAVWCHAHKFLKGHILAPT